MPYASVSYGPLLFALPIADTTDANTPDASARWKFALDVQNPNLTVERTAMPARWDWPLAAPLKLRVNAAEIAWNPDLKDPRLPLLPATQRGGLASIKFKSWLIFDPDLEEAMSAAAIDGDDDTKYITTVDVYRVHTDTSTQATLLWEPDAFACCGTCVACQL